MNFTDLCNEVFTLTNRPDLVAETQLAVRAATLRAHHMDFFPKDIYETYYQFTLSAYQQQLPTTTIPNFRALKYVRKYYPGVTNDNQYQSGQLPPLQPFYNPGANLPDGRFFKVLDPSDVLDSYSLNRIDVAYLAGTTININSGDQFQYILVGAYVNPDITPAGWNSWIGISNPYAIVCDAAGQVFKTIGYDEQYQAYQALTQMEYAQLQTQNVLAVGS